MTGRLITLFLIIIFLGRIIGYFPIFKIEQYTIRREIKTKLKSSVPDSELKVFSYPVGSENARKYGDEHEFEFQGEMYDVVRRVRKGNILKLYCFHDKEESELFDRLDNLVKNRMNASDHPFRNVVNIFQKTFHSVEPVLRKPGFSETDHSNLHLFGYLNTYRLEFVKKFVPPPRFLF